MQIEFENGSIIKSVDTITDSTRGITSKNFIAQIDTTRPWITEIKYGVKIEIRDYLYKQLLENEYIQENFKLNVIRLNRWWYSIYFDEKCSHEYEKVKSGEVEFCSGCGIRL